MDHHLNTLAWVIGLLGASYLLGSQIASLKNADRSVQVRGAAEQPVVADLATWSLNISSVNNDLAAAQQSFTTDLAKLKAFLIQQGLPEADLETASLNVSDAAANQYNESKGPRFSINGGITVRTTKLEAIRQAKNNLSQLVTAGVVLTNSYGPNYAFTKLNEAKLPLITAATTAAQQSAQQFAADSGSRLSGIRKARQGTVEILGRDAFLPENEQINKVLRVVTTIDYAIK